MKTYFQKSILTLALFATTQRQLSAQGTAFTYQGRLNDTGIAANGRYDLKFTVYDTNQPPENLIAGPLTNSATAVSNGLFTVSLDFGAGIFTGPNRWLEIAARTNGSGVFTTLAPRQPLTPSPYAIFANTASNVLGAIPSSQITGTISATLLPANVVTNTETGVTLGGMFSGNGGGLTNLNASALATGTVLTNVLAGFQAPYYAAIGGGQNNTANNTYAVVSGGYNNTAGYQATVPGGSFNVASGFYSFAAGQQAQALHQGAFVWADSQPFAFASIGNDSFNVRAYGGVNFQTRGAPFTINNSNVLTTAYLLNFWQTGGNAGTSLVNGNFLGTTDFQPLLVKVNGQQAVRYEPTAGTPNVIGGYTSNSVAAGVLGASIGGGGQLFYPNAIGGGGQYGTIAGGYGNSVLGYGGAVLGGAVNSANGTFTGVGGGEYNSSLGGFSWIGGGYQNAIQINDNYSTISGGINNTILSTLANVTIGGGSGNTVGTAGALQGGDASGATISGGVANTVSGTFSIIGGGSYNTIGINSSYAAVGGGNFNLIQTNANAATISGGEANDIQASSDHSVIGGGDQNNIATNSGGAVIGGGVANTVSGTFSVIGGGASNTARGSGVTISGGIINSASDYYSVVAGGTGNNAAGYGSSISGGIQNNIEIAYDSTISGGNGNTIQTNSAYGVIGGGNINSILTNAYAATIGGGENNNIQANSSYSVIGGGDDNTILAGIQFATVPGGEFNVAGGSFSFAAGCQAQALHRGAFVWADTQNTAFASTASDQFCIRAQGGVQFDPSTSLYFGSVTRQMLNLWSSSYGVGVQSSTLYERSTARFSWFKGGVHSDVQNDPGTGGTVLMTLTSGGLTVNGTLASTSDRNAKEDFAPVNSQDVLAKVAALPITKWIYKTDTGTRHIGPMAQDFYAAFAVGPDDKHITTVDEGGVALAAIQGLNQKLEQKETELTKLQTRLEKLEQLLVNKTGETK